MRTPARTGGGAGRSFRIGGTAWGRESCTASTPVWGGAMWSHVLLALLVIAVILVVAHLMGRL
jgi:hypothetical protein